MIRAALLAACAALALAPQQAQAQASVYCTNCSTEPSQMASWARQVQDMLRQYQQMRAQYEATVRNLGAGNLSGALGGLTRTYSPAATSIPGLLRGQGSFGQAGGFANENLHYMPPASDQWTAEMERRRMTTANAQALAASGMEDADQRIRELEALQAQIDDRGNTVTDTGLLQAQIAGFQQNIALNRAKMEQVATMLATANRVELEREEQRQRESADIAARESAWGPAALGATWGGPTGSAPAAAATNRSMALW